jgi:hypothetical protein
MFTADGVTLRLALKAWQGAARQDAAYAFTSAVDGTMLDNAVGVSGMTKAVTYLSSSSRKPPAAIRDRQKHSAGH